MPFSRSPALPAQLLRGGLFLLAGAVLAPFWVPVLLGVSLAIASLPTFLHLAGRLERWMPAGVAAHLSAWACSTVWAAVLLVPTGLLVWSVAPEMARLLSHPPDAATLYQSLRTAPWIGGLIQAHAGDVRRWLQAHPLQTLTGVGLRHADVLSRNTILVLFHAVITLLVLHMSLVRRAALEAQATRWMRQALGPDLAQSLGRSVVQALRSTLLGIIGLAAWDAFGVGLLALALGLPNPVLWGLASALLSVIPAGITLVVVAGFALLAAQGHMTGAGLFLVVSYVWTLVGDFGVKPRLTAGQMHAPFLLVLLSILGGVAAFGFIGLLLGPTIMLVALDLLSDNRSGVVAE